MVANTLTGIAHFHEIPGEGTLDFAASFQALTGNGFSGYGSVELYHHVSQWETALADSYQHFISIHLSKFRLVEDRRNLWLLLRNLAGMQPLQESSIIAY